jgi:hypothetical protein
LEVVLSNIDAIEPAAEKIKEYVLTKFSWNVIVQQYWALYTEVLVNKS